METQKEKIVRKKKSRTEQPRSVGQYQTTWHMHNWNSRANKSFVKAGRKVCCICLPQALPMLNAAQYNQDKTSQLPSAPSRRKKESGTCIQHSGFSGRCTGDWFMSCPAWSTDRNSGIVQMSGWGPLRTKVTATAHTAPGRLQYHRQTPEGNKILRVPNKKRGKPI